MKTVNSNTDTKINAYLTSVENLARKQYTNVGFTGEVNGLHLYLSGARFAAIQLAAEKENEKNERFKGIYELAEKLKADNEYLLDALKMFANPRNEADSWVQQKAKAFINTIEGNK